MNSALQGVQGEGRAASLEGAAPDGARLFIGERGGVQGRPPSCLHEAIIWLEGFLRCRKNRLLGIATRHEKKTNHPVREAKIFRYEKEVAAVSPKLRTLLSAAALISGNADTAAKICWNYAPKGDKRRLLLAFARRP